MELIQEYLALVIDVMSPKEFSEKVYFADFSKEHNRKVTRMRKIAAAIERSENSVLKVEEIKEKVDYANEMLDKIDKNPEAYKL